MKLFVILITLAVMAGCAKEDPVKPHEGDYIVFGSFYGMCQGEACVEIFKYEGGKLYEDSRDLYPSMTEMPYSGSYTQIENKITDELEYLLKNIPQELLDSGPATFGVPDSRDQGGMILQCKINGAVKYWLLDMNTDALPDYLRNYAERMKAAIMKIKGIQ